MRGGADAVSIIGGEAIILITAVRDDGDDVASGRR